MGNCSGKDDSNANKTGQGDSTGPKDGAAPDAESMKDKVESQAFKNEKLIQAARRNDVQITTKCLSMGSNVNTRDNDGLAALHYAMYPNRKELIKELIKHKANLDIAENHGFTPLHWAAMNSNTVAIGMLLDAGACVNSRNDAGQTALVYARKSIDADRHAYREEPYDRSIITEEQRAAVIKLLEKHGGTV